MDFLALLQQYMDGYAVLIAIGMTQLIKYFLPSIPGQEPSTVKWSWARRIMPVLPIVLATAVVVIKECVVCPTGSTKMAWDDGIVKGLVSGFAAAYLYRTAKVMIFDK
jgi:hypothetical protein